MTSSAGFLSSDNCVPGQTPGEIAHLAKGQVNDWPGVHSWAPGGCTSFVWGITNLAGAPLFDSLNGNMTFNNNPTTPLDAAYSVPHSPGHYSGTANVSGDGWDDVSVGSSVHAIKTTVQKGDVVRIYGAGNTNEDSFHPNGDPWAHSFVVLKVHHGHVKVVDNWSGPLGIHSFQEISDFYAPDGQFQAAYISRLNTDYCEANFNQDNLQGHGRGDWSSIDALEHHYEDGATSDHFGAPALSASALAAFDDAHMAFGSLHGAGFVDTVLY